MIMIVQMVLLLLRGGYQLRSYDTFLLFLSCKECICRSAHQRKCNGIRKNWTMIEKCVTLQTHWHGSMWMASTGPSRWACNRFSGTGPPIWRGPKYKISSLLGLLIFWSVSLAPTSCLLHYESWLFRRLFSAAATMCGLLDWHDHAT